MTFIATQALDDAMLSGGIDGILDADAGNAYAIVFQGATALVTVVFAKPATMLVDHELVLQQDNLAGDLVMVQGDADGFELYNGANVLLGGGDVSGPAGGGAMKITGSDPSNPTRLFAGARVLLNELKFA